MSVKKQNSPNKPQNDSFEAQATEQSTGLVAEFWEFLRTNKKWWMIPIVVTLLLVTGLVLLGGTALAPFIYTLF
jgi:uncharacterized protein DUF5989